VATGSRSLRLWATLSGLGPSRASRAAWAAVVVGPGREPVSQLCHCGGVDLTVRGGAEFLWLL